MGDERNHTSTYTKEEYDLLQWFLAFWSSGPQTNSVQPGTFSGLDLSWIIDSGATYHMTANQGILTSLHNTSYPPVKLADGSSCPVRGIRSIQNPDS
ncbi:hypothetical protein HanRHA438_Chr01g0036851 [Helianthus annuus]|nr:hypothetical protein HanRHA438_Chr01g0036851 [Helianthus annuus]